LHRGTSVLAFGRDGMGVLFMHILVVDNEPLVCDALAGYLKQIGSQISEDPISVTPSYTLSDAISALASNTPPDFVFLDLNLDNQNRNTATLERFQQHNKDKVPVIVFTGIMTSDPNAPDIVRRCLEKHGAQSILLKGTQLDAMFVGLRRILSREDWISNDIVSLLLKSSTPAYDLTPRQWEVARAVARGLKDKEIARDLKLSPDSVRQILAAIYKRLGIHSRVELILKMRGEGE
jgi:DNA-binding NarL/FixJ family response regulator